ncbi:hypothetical protein DACRYDRAFT_25174, partial [Dacryopinax primogenitus]
MSPNPLPTSPELPPKRSSNVVLPSSAPPVTPSVWPEAAARAASSSMPCMPSIPSNPSIPLIPLIPSMPLMPSIPSMPLMPSIPCIPTRCSNSKGPRTCISGGPSSLTSGISFFPGYSRTSSCSPSQAHSRRKPTPPRRRTSPARASQSLACSGPELGGGRTESRSTLSRWQGL